MAQKFNKTYFINSSVSNYKNYTEQKFEELANDLIKSCKIEKDDIIHDFGCATGGLLAEFKNLGFNNIRGTDISKWAIDFGKKNFKLQKELEYYNLNLLSEQKDWLICLDVLEHLPEDELSDIFKILKKCEIKKGIIVRIPVSKREGSDFFLGVSKNDRTHVQIHSKSTWIKMFDKIGFTTEKRFNEKEIYESEGVLARVFVKDD